MNAIPDYQIFQFSLWRTIAVARTEAGYAIFETPDRFWRERMAEAVLRIVGVGLILAGYIQWFLPDTMLQGNPMLARMVLSGLFMGTGIALYFFASRGFRKEVHFEVLNRQISMGRLNSKDRCLISRQIPMDRIESLFIGRASTDAPMATLNIRLTGLSRAQCIMRGGQSEIEELHRQLSRDIQIAMTIPAEITGPRGRIRPTMLRKTEQARPVSAFRAESCAKSALAFGGGVANI